MVMKALTLLLVAVGSATVTATGTSRSVAEINGEGFSSPLNGQTVNVTGLVTAVKKQGKRQGIYLRSTQPNHDLSTSDGLFVSMKNIPNKGDIVTVDGTVFEERKEKRRNDLAMTVLRNATASVISSDNLVEPWVIGRDTPTPPTKKFTSLDGDDVFDTFNKPVRSLSTENLKLDPKVYGIDFWKALRGQLVTMNECYAIGRSRAGGTFPVRGDWKTTNINGRGGVTLVGDDANPDTISIGSPLDGSRNPGKLIIGDYLGNITGVVGYFRGSFWLWPLTSVQVESRVPAKSWVTSLESKGQCEGISVATYNVHEMGKKSVDGVAKHIVENLKNPDLIFLQGVRADRSRNKETTAQETLDKLTKGLKDTGNVEYKWTEVAPVNGQDGGYKNANIRTVYLYKSKVLELVGGERAGKSLDANQVVRLENGKPALKLNPGRIDPTNDAFVESRKPLAAQWQLVGQPDSSFFTVNVHFRSKYMTQSLYGDERPPRNSHVDERAEEAAVTANFVTQILDLDKNAHVIVAGGFNELSHVRHMLKFAEQSRLYHVDDVAKEPVDPVERYTYQGGSNAQQVDYLFVSEAAARDAHVEHVHVNTGSVDKDTVSNHDPSVMLVNLCS